jgi:hypothetical protein
MGAASIEMVEAGPIVILHLPACRRDYVDTASNA